MSTADTVPLLDRITGTLFPPGSTSPLDAIAVLVHPSIAIVPHRAVSGKGKRFNLIIRLEGKTVVQREAIVAGVDDLITALLLNEPPPYAVPDNLLNRSSYPISGTVQTILRDDKPGHLHRVITTIVESSERQWPNQYLQLLLPDGTERLNPSIGAPILQEGRLLGVVVQGGDKDWQMLEAVTIRGSGALRAATQRLAGPAADYTSRLRSEEQPAIVDEGANVVGATDAKVALTDRGAILSREEEGDFDPAEYWQLLSPAARDVFAHAESMRAVAGTPEVRMMHLFGGIAALRDTPEERALAEAAGGSDGFRALLREYSDGLIPPDEYTWAPRTALPPVSTAVVATLVDAAAIARRERLPEISTLHLLQGALLRTDDPLIAALRERGMTPDRVFERVRSIRAIGEGVGGVRVAADVPRGEPEAEMLGIGPEVRALATLLAAEETPLPLSLGLFGDWGSGKSFFMRQLETEIARRSEEARKGGGGPHCAGIVQITFNAWHYIDTNLWASLAAAIFQELAQALDAGDEDVAARELKDTLLAETSHLQQVRDDAREKKRVLDQALSEEQTRLERLDAEARTVRRSLTTGELARAAWRTVADRKDVKDAVDEAADHLGLPPAKVAVAEARAQLMEMGRIRQSWWGLREALAERSPGRRWVIVLGITLGLAGVTMLLDRGFGLGIFGWIDRLPGFDALVSGIALVTAGLAAGTAAIRPVLGAVKSAVQVLEKAKAENLARVEAERKQAREALLKRQARITQDKVEAEGQIAATSRDLEALERRLAELHPERRLTTFVEERGSSTEYTRHLGVIASARRDFEKLSERLGEALRKAREEGAAGKRPAIDRIVLYIDDLDRCPEEKVVEVLQAVHLLLAFDLFVVVVGVDSRWLLHSLRHHSAAFRTRRDDEGDGVSEEERVHWQSTPMNYLEKIFQIPFTLRPMGRAGFGKLIDDLAAPKKPAPALPTIPVSTPTGRAPADSPPPASAGVTVPAASSAASSAGPAARTDASAKPSPAATAPNAAPPVSPAGTDAGAEAAKAAAARAEAEAAARRAREQAEEAAERLAIRAWERDFMKTLHPLIPTPRAAKRFLNVYRLIRGTLTPPCFEDLAGELGEYRAVLTLLALLTGYPAEATVILRDLMETHPKGSWREYLQGLERRRMEADAARAAAARRSPDARPEANGAGAAHGHGEPPEASVATEHPFDGLEGIEPARWEEMLEKARAIPLPEDQTCDHFVRWAPEVGRYSFYSGRVLLGRSAPAEEPARPFSISSAKVAG